MASVWRGYITFELISIPVQLFKAARAERVALRQVYRVSPEPTPGPSPVPPRTSTAPRSGKKRTKETPAEPEERVEEVIAPVRRVASTGAPDGILADTKILKG